MYSRAYACIYMYTDLHVHICRFACDCASKSVTADRAKEYQVNKYCVHVACGCVIIICT